MKWLNVLFSVFVALFIGTVIQLATGLNAYAVAGTLLAVKAAAPLFIQESSRNLAYMSVIPEIWEKHVEDEIFSNNKFMRKSKNADEYVIGGKAVHIPQSGGSGNVVKNRTVLPATIRKRNDTDIIYLVDEYTTDPVLIPDADSKELSYDKRSSVIGEDTDKLVEVIAEEVLYNWVNSPVYGAYGATSLAAARIMETTGANVAASAPGATGLRKGASLTDLQMMRTKLQGENRWFEGKMNTLITPQMEAQMFPADSVVTATYMNNVTEAERRAGVMYKAQGFNIMTRSSVYVTAGDKSIIAPGEAGAADHCEAALFWYENAVELAYSGVEMFFRLRDPQNFGDIYSFLARMGSRAVRNNYEGIWMLKQAASA